MFLHEITHQGIGEGYGVANEQEDAFTLHEVQAATQDICELRECQVARCNILGLVDAFDTICARLHDDRDAIGILVLDKFRFTHSTFKRFGLMTL